MILSKLLKLPFGRHHHKCTLPGHATPRVNKWHYTCCILALCLCSHAAFHYARCQILVATDEAVLAELKAHADPQGVSTAMNKELLTASWHYQSGLLSLQRCCSWQQRKHIISAMQAHKHIIRAMQQHINYTDNVEMAS